MHFELRTPQGKVQQNRFRRERNKHTELENLFRCTIVTRHGFVYYLIVRSLSERHSPRLSLKIRNWVKIGFVTLMALSSQVEVYTTILTVLWGTYRIALLPF